MIIAAIKHMNILINKIIYNDDSTFFIIEYKLFLLNILYIENLI